MITQQTLQLMLIRPMQSVHRKATLKHTPYTKGEAQSHTQKTGSAKLLSSLMSLNPFIKLKVTRQSLFPTCGFICFDAVGARIRQSSSYLVGC